MVKALTPLRRGWQPLRLSPGNYRTPAVGAGRGPFRVRVTDIFGHQVIARGIRLRPGTLQRTTLLMYTRSAAPPPGPSASAVKTPGVDAHRSYPRRSVTPEPHCRAPTRPGAAPARASTTGPAPAEWRL